MKLITCTQSEALFAEYLDGTVGNSDRLAMDTHLATCAECGALAADMRLAMRFMQSAVEIEPPVELMSRILEQTTGLRPAGVPAWRYRLTGWWDRALHQFVRPAARGVLDPRFAMSMAMAMISCSMLLSFAGVDVRQVKLNDLQPANLYHSAERGVHTAGSRVTKYYNNLRVVYEIQSQLQALREDRDSNAAAPASPVPQPQPSNQNNKQKPSRPAMKKDGRTDSQVLWRRLQPA